MPQQSTPWPPTVPVLTGRDICRVDFTSPNGCQHCLIGWAEDVFRDQDACDMALDAIRKLIPHKHRTLITLFNDDPSVSKSKVANVWNRAMRELGYTERV